MSILDYTTEDVLFAHWLRRKRQYLAHNQPVPAQIEEELNRLRPLRNPATSVFITDRPYE